MQTELIERFYQNDWSICALFSGDAASAQVAIFALGWFWEPQQVTRQISWEAIN